MPSVPLIDFETLDLSRVVVTKERLRDFCKQRGEFEMLDGLLHFDLEGKRAVGFKDLTPRDWWAAGHIPGRPIFPGALQCEGAAQLCTYDFMHRRPDLAGAFVGFAGMNETRFRGIVEPPCRLIFVGEVQTIRKTMFTYYAQAFVDQKLVFETEIMGVVV
jgi:3-hydroxymyristoyl/3-hydroxydecanoyl-(acyl carrier protein) dehydratase